ncbi:MAG: S-layer homology domain-containing protein [Firmicutes bacterium]|nr:S-layer homology domain-containing protein [Bacillota bacterium]
MHRTSKLLIILLALVVAVGLVPAAAMAAPTSFSDVPSNAWYYSDVQKAVSSGLVSGYPNGTFGPNNNMTYAEAIKLAATMYKLAATGSNEFSTGTPWYQPYVDYAKAVGIISKNYAWNTPATRAGYMEIFANAIPDTVATAGMSPLTAINSVADGSIPDVPMTHPQAAAIYKLYRAGILQGSDAQHNCRPNSNIQRSEVAAILTRMMSADERLTFSMGQVDPLTITSQPKDVVVAVGDKASYTVTVTGGKAPYTFEWQQEYGKSTGEAVEKWSVEKPDSTLNITTSGNTSTLTVPRISENYHLFGRPLRCVITDANGTTVISKSVYTTKAATAALAITSQPKDVTIGVDEDADFSVKVSGGKAPYSYEWHRVSASGTEQIPSDPAWFDGIGTATLTTKACKATEDGDKYYCVITDASGNQVTSRKAVLTVEDATALRIVSQPKSVTVEVGEDVVVSVKVSGGKAPYTYEWHRIRNDGEENSLESLQNPRWFEGVNTATFRAKESLLDIDNGVQYYCVITDDDGNKVISQKAKVTVVE